MAGGELRINQELMQQVLDCFSTFTGVRATFDYGDRILYGNNQRLSSFCRELRKIDCYQKRCLECDAEAKAYAEQNKGLYIYKCHMGFWEAIVPVTVRDELVSYLTIGQIVDFDTRQESFDQVVRILKRDKVSPEVQEKLCRLFGELRRFTYKEVEAGVSLLKMMGDYLGYQKVVELYYRTLVGSVTDYLEQNYAREITSAEIEKITQYRYSYVCDIFKRQKGCTIKQFLEEVRLKHAVDLLQSTGWKIYEISEKCGYKNSYYFNRVFRRRFSCTPQEYRSRLCGNDK